MAMLMTNEVFARTWGERAGPAPDDGLLADADRPRPRRRTPTSCSWPRPTGTWSGRSSSRGSTSATTSASTTGSSTSPARSVRGHLQADRGLPGTADPLHREPRRAARGGDLRAGAGAGGGGRDVDARGRAALPRRPARRPPHPHPGVPRPRSRRAGRRRAARVLRAAAAGGRATRTCATASGSSATAPAGPTTTRAQQLVAWCWAAGDTRRLVVVNLADAPAQARIHLPWPQLHGEEWELSDQLSDVRVHARRRRTRRRWPVRRPRALGVSFPRLRARGTGGGGGGIGVGGRGHGVAAGPLAPAAGGRGRRGGGADFRHKLAPPAVTEAEKSPSAGVSRLAHDARREFVA